MNVVNHSECALGEQLIFVESPGWKTEATNSQKTFSSSKSECIEACSYDKVRGHCLKVSIFSLIKNVLVSNSVWQKKLPTIFIVNDK